MNKQLLQQKILNARKNGRDEEKMALQYVLSAIQSVEGRGGGELNEDQILKIIEKEIKSLKEIIDLNIDKNNEKIMVDFLEKLLPAKINIDRYDAIIENALDEVTAIMMQDMGRVIAKIKERYGSTLDYKIVSQKVKEKLI